jgi:hypothetical protein
MTKRFSGAGKLAAISLAVAAAVAMPLSASAHDGWGGHGGWGHGGGHGWDRGGGWDRGDYYRHGGGHWSGGRWIAGAIITGAVAGIVADSLRPEPVYYEQPRVVYREPTVIYEDAPIVTHRVVTRTVVYDNGYPTRYVRDDDDD